MIRTLRLHLWLGLLLATGSVAAQVQSPAVHELQAFGRALFFDVDLSRNQTQACATCHDPAHAFIDVRQQIAGGAVSVGDDGHSIGDRNAPTLTYAALIPPFHRNVEGQPVGGYFLDGRALTLEAQISGPLLSPIEMNQPDFASVIERVLEKPAYRASLAELFGSSVLVTTAAVEAAVITAITAFERSDQLSTFDSKYDRWLRGEVEFTREEHLGRELFFSDLTNCSSCHLHNPQQISPRETFTNHRYHNIGVPVNEAVRAQNGLRGVDAGLLANPAVSDPGEAGRFRVPGLRNVAVTGPYMHNGVFTQLHTAVFFYGRYTVRNATSNINPETGLPWAEPETADSIDLDLLRRGQPLDHLRASHIVAFLRTLTDARYEHLLP